MKKRKKIPVLYIVAVTIFLILTLGPFVWAFIVSVTPEYEMFKNTMNLFPTELTWKNYEILFQVNSPQHIRLFTGLLNSMKAVGCTILLGVPIALVSGYVLSRMEFPGKKVIRNTLLITMVIPVFATIIPLFRIFVDRGLLNNTFWLSMIYVSSFLPMNVWLISNYFDTLPKELEEAARVDGCGRVHTFLKIILPISYPVIFSSILIMFLSGWSQFQIPLILASSVETKPVSIVTSEFMSKDMVQYGITAAAGLLAVIPPAIAALIFRKFLVSGMTKGSIKG